MLFSSFYRYIRNFFLCSFNNRFFCCGLCLDDFLSGSGFFDHFFLFGFRGHDRFHLLIGNRLQDHFLGRRLFVFCLDDSFGFCLVGIHLLGHDRGILIHGFRDGENSRRHESYHDAQREYECTRGFENSFHVRFPLFNQQLVVTFYHIRNAYGYIV